jgi:hypothetical protein
MLEASIHAQITSDSDRLNTYLYKPRSIIYVRFGSDRIESNGSSNADVYHTHSSSPLSFFKHTHACLTPKLPLKQSVERLKSEGNKTFSAEISSNPRAHLPPLPLCYILGFRFLPWLPVLSQLSEGFVSPFHSCFGPIL